MPAENHENHRVCPRKTFCILLKMKEPGFKSIFWSLPILAVLLYVACMPWMELRGSDEAVYATIASEMARSHNFLQPTFHGQPVGVFPLYPWLVCLFSGFQQPGEIAVRLPSVLAIFGMALGAFLMARRHRDAHAGVLAALIVLTSFGAMRVGIVGQGEALHAALLSGAWFLWHTLGPIKRKWNTAWGVSLGLIFLDLFNVGLRGVILFYLPFLFTTMPPRTRRLLRSKEHLRWLVFFALASYLWVTLFCKQSLLGWNALVGPLSSSAAPEGFFHHLLFFPFQCFWDMLPWGLFLWMPFCLALRPLEPSGSICGFLRAAVLCIFVSYWLLPGHSSLLILAALPPMAVMIAFTLPIVMHRNEPFWRRFGYLGTAVVSVGLFYAIVHWAWVAAKKIQFENWDAVRAFPEYGIAVVIVLLLLLVAVCVWGRRPNALGLAWLAAGMRVTWVVMVSLTAFLTLENRGFVARQLMEGVPEKADAAISVTSASAPIVDVKEEIPEGCVLYFMAEHYSYPAQLFYTGHAIRRIQKGEQLPKEEEVILAAENQPVFPGWTWDKINGPVNFNLHREVVPSPLAVEPMMFTWKFSGLVYRRVEVISDKYPEYGRDYYLEKPYNLYRGRYSNDK